MVLSELLEKLLQLLPHTKPYSTCYIPVYPDVDISHITRNQVVNLSAEISL